MMDIKFEVGDRVIATEPICNVLFGTMPVDEIPHETGNIASHWREDRDLMIVWDSGGWCELDEVEFEALL